MKYNSSNKPLVCMQTQSTCYKETRKMTIKGILWHSTGANNPALKRYVQPSDTKPAEDTYSKAKWLELLGKNAYSNDWNHTYVEIGLNCWIGKLANGTVTTVQTLPWNYRPWGCGAGSKGSCNDGWIQFEICEDGLTDKTYFNKIYKEACEITAYLCKKYNIDPKGTVTHNGVKVPTILCHKDSHDLGLGSGHSDVYHWFNKHGKTMENARNDVAALLKAAGSSSSSSTSTATSSVKSYKVVTAINRYANASDAAAQTNADATKLLAGTYYIYNKYPTGVNGMYNISTDKTGKSAGSWINPKENVIKESTSTQLYRVRKSKDDAKSQKGAYSNLQNAIDVCQKAGKGYHVFDKDFKIVYSYKAPITLSSIAVTKMPTKTTYTVGEKYDGTGLVVKATYSDKTTKTITDYTISGFKSTKAGTVTIKVTYEGKSTTFKLTIKEKSVKTETTKVVAVYDLDYPVKTKIIDKTVKRTNTDCVKAIKKILANNKSFDVNIAKAFFKLAPKYNIDPMMAISQAIVETGWFKFQGSSVSVSQHNYCGLGATGGGTGGASFATIEEGVTAQLQHLYAYGCKTALPSGEKVVDPRFSLVTRGLATYWQQLAGRWACPGYDQKTYNTPQKAMEAENTYGQKILTVCNAITALSVSKKELEKYFPTTAAKQEASKETSKEPTKEAQKETPKETNKETQKEASKESSKETTKETSKTEEAKSPDKTVETQIPDTDDLQAESVNMQAVANVIKKVVQTLLSLFNKGE